MGFIAWVAVGVAVGFVSSKVVEDPDLGIGVDLVLGVIGAVLGGVCSSSVWEPRRRASISGGCSPSWA
jgi:uncharacterized membrane protein YeaQ/YmgE (transglycosylase-associated protein family)